MAKAPGPHVTLANTFDGCACASFDKQLHLADLYGESAWGFSMDTGILTFDEQDGYECQVLGTESEATNTWRWAWGNGASIPANLAAASVRIREAGEKHAIPEFTQRDVPLESFDGHYLALLASSLCKAKAYYRGPYEGGAVFLLITDEGFPANEAGPLERIRSVFPQAIAALPISNHRRAFDGYLKYLGLTGESADDTVSVRHGGGLAQATFDHLNRLAKLKVKA